MTTSISDPFPQFTHIERLTDYTQLKMKKLRQRDYRHFNNQEFMEELRKIDWVKTLAGTRAEEAFSIFYTAVDDVLNAMAPTKLLSRKEIGIAAKPWLTKGILKSIQILCN